MSGQPGPYGRGLKGTGEANETGEAPDPEDFPPTA